MTLRSKDERGVVAVIVAICAILIFSLAALAVDLGNAMVRKRDVQSQADFAALAGGSKLGSNTKLASDPAVIMVADYLNENMVQDDDAGPTPVVTPDQLVDGGAAPYPAGAANGEVYFESDYVMRVVAPEAQVNFGLANIMGFSGAGIQAEAVVGLRSPGPVVPFFLPKDCQVGDFALKAGNYNPNAPTFTPSPATGNAAADIDNLAPLTVGGAVTTLHIFGKKFTKTAGVPPTADFFHEATGDRVPNVLTSGYPTTIVSDAADDEVKIDLPAQVLNTAGKWYVRLDNGYGYSKTVGTFVVGDPSPPPAGCGQRATGDFGVIQSPRKDVTQLADAAALNMAKGLDHNVVPFDTTTFTLPTPQQDSCQGNGGTPPAGAINDKTAVDGNNCLNVLNGGNIDTVTSGFITGGNTSQGPYEGKLVEDTLTGCDKNGLSEEAFKLGEYINDDVLSCFLKPGIRVGDVSSEIISSAAEKSISPRIFESPRFLVVPMIDYPVNPQNGFYPIVGYVPAFITDEAAASTNGTSYTTSANGVIIQSSKVVSLTVVAINPAALPDTAAATTGTIPYTGSGTKVITLLD